MIAWTEELEALIAASSRAVLSYPGEGGYPVALPLSFTFDVQRKRFVLPVPVGHPAAAQTERVSMTLLRYDARSANERYLPFYGQLVEEGDTWYFIPSRVVMPRWQRR